jgi:hypothetical protein
MNWRGHPPRRRLAPLRKHFSRDDATVLSPFKLLDSIPFNVTGAARCARHGAADMPEN